MTLEMVKYGPDREPPGSLDFANESVCPCSPEHVCDHVYSIELHSVKFSLNFLEANFPILKFDSILFNWWLW